LFDPLGYSLNALGTDSYVSFLLSFLEQRWFTSFETNVASLAERLFPQVREFFGATKSSEKNVGDF